MADAQEEVLRRQLEHIAKEQQYGEYEASYTPIPSDGANYTSSLFSATISAPGKHDLNLFAKVAAVGEKFRQQMFTSIFDSENYVYNTLADFYTKIQDKYNVPVEQRHKMPKIYRFDQTYLEETLVLEDLTAQGFTTYDRFKSMDWEYASRALEQLAKWHALSLVFQEEYPEEFDKAVQILKIQDITDNQKMSDTLNNFMSNAFNVIANEEHRVKLSNFLEKAKKGESIMKVFQPLKRPVFAHGDFKMSNIMHKLQESQQKLEVVLVDYQCVHLGCAAKDLLFFLLSGTDGEFREKHFYPVLDHYYGHLSFMLRLMERDPEVVFPREDFDYELKETMPWGVVATMFALPIMTLESENAPKIDGNFDIGSIAAVKTSDLYEIRMNELVRDFVKWGVI